MTDNQTINTLREIQRTLTQIQQNTTEPETKQKTTKTIQQIQKIINQETTEKIQYGGIIRQRFLNHLAGDIGYTDARRNWFLNRATTMILATDEMDRKIREIYKDKYPALKNKIYQTSTILEELKYHYDMMLENPKDTQKYKYHNQEVKKRLIKMPLINEEIDTIFYHITEKTCLGQYTVPQHAISRILQETKKTEIMEERKTRPEPEKQEPTTGG